MKNLILPFLVLILLINTMTVFAQSVSINNTGVAADPKAILDISTTLNNKGVLFPRLTTLQITAMGVVPAGMMVFNTDVGDIQIYNATATSWNEVGSANDKPNATVAPIGTDDGTKGYIVGSIWVNINTNKAYVCLDVTAGAAIWKEITLTGDVTLTGIQTLTNKTLTTPKVDVVLDALGGKEIILTPTAAAVNEITITNAITATGPTIGASGTDLNVDLNLTPKGTGNVLLSGLKYPAADGIANQILKTDGLGNLSWVANANAGTGIYTGSGTLAANTTITQGTNLLNFTTSVANGFSVAGGAFSVDGSSNRVGIGTTTPNEKLTIFGAVSLSEQTPLGATIGYGKIYASTTDAKLHFISSGGADFDLTNTAPTGAAGGDLSGTYPNPTVTALSGANLSFTTLLPNDVLTYNGINWSNQQIIHNATSLNGIAINTPVLSTNEVLTYNGSLWVNSPPSTTLYSGSGSLSGATIVTQGLNTLSFTSTSKNGFNIDGTTFSVDALNNRVGIGLTSPVVTLDVAGTIQSSLGYNIAGASILYTSVNNTILNASGSGEIRLTQGGFSNLVISASGNTGIGTTAPGAKLDVAGTIRVSSSAGTGEINRTTNGTDKTGLANLLPIGYMTSSNDATTYLTKTPNLTITKTGVGRYTITVTDFLGNFTTAMPIVNVSIFDDLLVSSVGFCTWAPNGANTIAVETFDMTGALADRGFSIIIYNP